MKRCYCKKCYQEYKRERFNVRFMPYVVALYNAFYRYGEVEHGL